MRRILALIALGVACLSAGCQQSGEDKAFVNAVLQGDTATVRQLKPSEANIEAANESGRTPLALAALKSHAEMVDLLLEKGANVNARDPSGMTPLMWAAFGGNPRIVEALLAKGADVNARDQKGDTALDWAQKLEVIAILKKAGAAP